MKNKLKSFAAKCFVALFSVVAFAFTAAADHTHCLCGASGSAAHCAAVHDETVLPWTEWTGTDSLPSSAGNYYLANDVVLTDSSWNKSAWLMNGVNLCLNGHNIIQQNNDKTTIIINAGATAAITDCSAKPGAIMHAAGMKGQGLTMNGTGCNVTFWNGCVCSNEYYNAQGYAFGAGMTVSDGCTATVYRCEFFDNKVTCNGDNAAGGALCSFGELNIYGGVFRNNSAGMFGGALAAGWLVGTSAGGIIRVYDGVFTNNVAAKGGAVAAIYSTYQPSIDIHGGLFADNTTTGDMLGGAIYAAAPVTIDGGVVRDNICTTGNGGGVYVASTGSLTLGGTAAITNNTANSAANNVYLASGKTIAISSTTPLAASAKIGVRTQTTPPVAITSNGATTDRNKFISDDFNYVVKHATDHLELSAIVIAQPSPSNNFTFEVNTNDFDGTVTYQWYRDNDGVLEPLAGETTSRLSPDKRVSEEKYCCQATFTPTVGATFVVQSEMVMQYHSHDDVEFRTPIGTPAELTALFNNGGSGCLTNDIQLSSTLSVSSGKTVNLCLNGFVITAPLTSTMAINYTTGNGLFLSNCQHAEHKFRVDYSGRWVRDEANGTNTVAGGCIVGANAQTIYASAANLKLSGINIVGGLDGSALEAHDAVVTVDNCGFYGNLAGYGGAIYLVGAAGQSSFKDCVFKGNMSTRTDTYGGGGAVYVKSYSVNTACFERCVFEGNSSYFHGGAIYDYNSSGNSTLVLTNCTLRGNFSQNYGGAVYAPNNMICSGCLIERNYGSYAGGVYCSKILTMEDSVVQYNTCNYYGGGLYLNSWGSDPLMTCTIKSSVIRGNRTSDDDNMGFGGGITVGSKRILDLYDVIIEDNYAARCGAIAAWNTVNQYGGIIRRNFGGVYGAVGAPTNFLTYNLIDGQIVDNCTGIKPYGDQNGGGVGSATTLNVGGTAYIYGNTNTLGQADDVVVNPNIGFIAGHPLTDGAKIGLGFFNALSYGGSQIRTAANDESVLKYFRANKSNYIVYEDASHAVGLKYPAATSIGSQAELTAAIAALTPGCTAMWNITGDFTVTETAAIKLNGFNLTINGNGHTLTAAQAGTELANVFDIESQGSSAALLSIKDLNLAVGDGFRTGINVATATGDVTARTEVECENVKITMAHTAAPVGGDAVALVNANAAVSLVRGSKITVNEFSRAAVDLTTETKDTVLAIESTSVAFTDKRPVATVNTDPLIKLTDNSSGAKRVAVDGVANTSLFWADLANGSGYNAKCYIPLTVTPVANTTYKVYAGTEEVEGPDYLVVSNATDVTVVYTAKDGYAFDDFSLTKTVSADTAKNPATIVAPVSPMRTAFIGSEEELIAAKSAINSDDYECRWIITNDFTLAQSVVISRKGVKIDIRGQGHTITATQDGALLPYVFDAVIQRSNESYVNFSDLTLVVGDGFRNGLQVQWSTEKGGGRSMKSTLSNVTVKMARTTAPMQGGSVKYGAALVNNNSEVTLKNDVTFVLDDWCWAAIDIEANVDRETTLTIDPVSNVGFFDRRSNEKKAVEPLVKLTDNSSSVNPTVIGPEYANLVWVELANGVGYSTHRHDGIAFTTAIGTEEELRNLCAAGGTGFLTNGIVVTGETAAWVCPGKMVGLCLNGYAITRACTTATNDVFYIGKNATLAVYECQETPRYFTADEGTGRWIPSDAVTPLMVKGGYICGGLHQGVDHYYPSQSERDTGGIYSTFKMFGGSLVGCTRGAVLSEWGLVQMSNVEIVGNSSKFSANDSYYAIQGAITAVKSAVFMTNVVIRANVGLINPACVFKQSSQVEIIGGAIRDNVATSQASAIENASSDLVLGGDLLVTNNFQMAYATICVEDGSSLVVRDQVRIVGNAKEGLGGGIVCLGSVEVAISNDVQIAGNYGGDLCAIKVGNRKPTIDFSGMSATARIGVAAAAMDPFVGNITIVPESAYSTFSYATAVPLELKSCFTASFVDQYLEMKDDGQLLLHARLYDQPAAANGFTYKLDTTLYTGASGEGSANYQWYPSTVTTAEVTDKTPDRPTSFMGYETYAAFDPVTRTWRGECNEDEGRIVFLGFNATKGSDITFSCKLASESQDFEPMILGADMSQASIDLVKVEGNTGFFKAVATTSKGSFLVVMADAGETVIVSNLVATTQTIDYAHPIAGQTGAAYDFATTPVDEGSFANVASFIDADGITTNFTMASDIINFHVNRDKDGNVIACYDQPINSQADLVSLFKTGGAGYLAADVQMTDVGEMFEIDVGTVVDLCLNGHVLDLNGGFISNEGTLRMVDCLDHATPHYFAVAEDMRWVLTNDVTAAKCVKGGVIYNGFHNGGDSENPGAVSAFVAATTIVSRVNFIGNGSAMYVGAYNGEQEESTKTVVEDCFIAGNVISTFCTIMVGNSTNHVFRNCVLTENLGWACGGIGTIEGPGFTMIGMVITNNYAIGFNAPGLSVAFGGAAFLCGQPVLGGKIVIKDNYLLTDDDVVRSNAGFFDLEENPGEYFGPAALLDSFSADSEIGASVANSALSVPQTYPFILALSNDTNFASCFIADDGVSIISYNAEKQVQMITPVTVHFDTYGGSTIADTNTFVGLKLLKPADPVRYGSAFNGWYTDAACTTAWDFENDLVQTANLTLHAGWTELMMLTYDAMGGLYENGAEIRVVLVLPTDPRYEFPDEPVRTNFTFLGWYDGIAPTANKVTEGAAVGVATNLFAKWESKAVEPSTPSGEGGTTADGLAVTNYRPTTVIADGNVVIPDTIDNSPTGKAIIEIGRSAYTPSKYAGTVKNVTIPQFVTDILPYAFADCQQLKSATFAAPRDYKTGEIATIYIRDWAFANTSLKTITFPAAGRYKIGHNAFSDVTCVEDIYLYGEIDIADWKRSPFRQIGTDLPSGQKVKLHLSPAKAADAKYVAAITNGMDNACVMLDQAVLGTAKTGSFTVSEATIVINFTIAEDSPWQLATPANTYMLFSTDLNDAVIGTGKVLKPTSVELQTDGSWKATFENPNAYTGFFRLCVGE